MKWALIRSKCMYEAFDHICAHMKLVYCVTIDCLQSDLIL